jgi:hypothetical protein
VHPCETFNLKNVLLRHVRPVEPRSLELEPQHSCVNAPVMEDKNPGRQPRWLPTGNQFVAMRNYSSRPDLCEGSSINAMRIMLVGWAPCPSAFDFAAAGRV